VTSQSLFPVVVGCVTHDGYGMVIDYTHIALTCLMDNCSTKLIGQSSFPIVSRYTVVVISTQVAETLRWLCPLVWILQMIIKFNLLAGY
jgi:hypothetical protein